MPHRRTRLTKWAFAVLAGALIACPSGPARSPNVLVVVVDTLRADRLGAYGNTRGLTPFLDRLAQQGVVFPNAYAASSWTVPSVASLLTSRYPSQHHAVTFTARLSEQEVTFAERLQQAGYLGAGFSANFRLLERLGYAQGFQFWRSDDQKPGGLKVTGAELRSQSLEWLGATWQRASPRPALLYVQYMEPHSPYNPPEPFRSRLLCNADDSQIDTAAAVKHFADLILAGHHPTPADVVWLERLYDGEVAAVDDEIRLLFTDLERRGFLDDAVIIVTADHGEEFEEHGGLEHGRTLYNESIHVPLIVIAPGIAAGQRIAENVSLIDVAPTLLDLLHLPAEPRFEGRSLLPLMQPGTRHPPGAAAAASGDHSSTDVFFELAPTGMHGAPQVHQRGILRGTVKLLLGSAGGRESYDLASDPGESQVDPPSIAPQASNLAKTLDSAVDSLQRRASAPVEGEPLDNASKERLRALGYQF